MKKKLFISYAHEDSDVLEALESHLNSISKRESYQGFLDVFIDKRKINAGFRWDSVIEEALENADGYVFLVSRHAMESEFISNQELPCIAFRHTQKKCPIYIFRVSAYSYEDEAILIEGTGESLKLGLLQHVGPWLNEDQSWYRSLESGVAEEALMKAATDICDGMFKLTQGEAEDERNEASSPTPPHTDIEKPRTPKKTTKPVLDNYLAFIDRTQVVNPLEAQVNGNIMVAVSATGTVTDWFEGLAMRLCFDRIPGVISSDGESAVSLKQSEYKIFKINWPNEENTTPVRESALWSPLLEKNGVTVSSDHATNMQGLWSKLSRLLNGGRRVVIHYFISTRSSDLKKDLDLAELLARQWQQFFEKVDKQLSGRMLLLFSVNDDFEGKPGFLPWSKKPLSADRLTDKIASVLGKSLGGANSEQGCCALQGGRLKKIEFPDIDVNWRDSIKATGFDENDIATFLAVVENKIPPEGISLYELRRELKQDSEVKKLFKIT